MSEMRDSPIGGGDMDAFADIDRMAPRNAACESDDECDAPPNKWRRFHGEVELLRGF